MHPKISIIIPCYNLEEYIHDTLKSLEYYTKTDIEYILVNDGSKDRTGDIIKEYCQHHSNCIYYEQINGGVSSARNSALKLARGEYIYLLDGDDQLSKDAIKHMLSMVNDNDADMIITPYSIVKFDGSSEIVPLNIDPGLYSIHELFDKTYIFPIAQKNIYKLDIIKKYNLQFNTSLKLGEVFEFTLRFIRHAKSIKIDKCVLFNYIMRQNSAIHSFNYNTDLTIINTMQQYVKNSDIVKQHSSFWITIFHLLISFTYTKYIRGGAYNVNSCKCINEILNNDTTKLIIRKMIFCYKSSLKDKIIGVYMYTTKTLGFKYLLKLNSLFSH